MPTLDVHKTYRMLRDECRFEEPVAEGLVKAMSGMLSATLEELATQSQLERTKTELRADIQAVRSELHTEIHAVKAELRTEIQGVRTDLQRLKAELLKVLLGAVFSIIGATWALLHWVR